MDSFAMATPTSGIANISALSPCEHDFKVGISVFYDNNAKVSYLMLAIIGAIISVASTTLNALFLFVLYQNKSMRNRANFLFMMLSICDLLTGIIFLPIYSTYMMILHNGKNECILSRITKMTGYSSVAITIVTIALITFNLYLAVVRPYYYEERVRTKGLLQFLVLAWLALIFITVISMFIPGVRKIYTAIFGAICLILFVIMCCLHVKINKETRKIDRNFPGSTGSFSSQKKTSKLASAILVAFGIAYLPSVIIKVYQMINGSNRFLKTYVDRWAECIALLNCLLNPIIYYYRMVNIRKKTIAMLCCRNTNSKVTVATIGSFDHT